MLATANPYIDRAQSDKDDLLRMLVYNFIFGTGDDEAVIAKIGLLVDAGARYVHRKES